MAWEHRFRGAHPPPAGQPRWYPVERALPGSPVLYLLLSHVLVGYWTHYQVVPGVQDKRTQPCYSPESCTGCEQRAGLNWYGFAAALRTSNKVRVIVMLPAEAARLVGTMRPSLPTLRGLIIGMQKAGAARHETVCVRHEGEEVEARTPQAHPIEETLRLLWRVPVLPDESPTLKLERGQA